MDVTEVSGADTVSEVPAAPPSVRAPGRGTWCDPGRLRDTPLRTRCPGGRCRDGFHPQGVGAEGWGRGGHCGRGACANWAGGQGRGEPVGLWAWRPRRRLGGGPGQTPRHRNVGKASVYICSWGVLGGQRVKWGVGGLEAGACEEAAEWSRWGVKGSPVWQQSARKVRTTATGMGGRVAVGLGG